MLSKKLQKMLIYLSVISLSLLISCFISFVGVGKSILSSKNIPKTKTRRIKIVLIAKFLLINFLFGLGLNLSCIIVKLYLHSKNKT